MDIVERLRSEEDAGSDPNLIGDAALEIERLRNAIKRGCAGFRNDGSAPPRMQILLDALTHNASLSGAEPLFGEAFARSES